MQITPTDLTTLTFTPLKNSNVTQRVFNVVNIVNSIEELHLVLVHIDKKHNDTDGDGTPDTLDAKFGLSLIKKDGTSALLNDKEVKISQVHSLNIAKISDGTIDIVDWIADISNQLIPVVVNKKSALTSWGGI